MPNNNDFLMHYGVKGQKWGVRKYQDQNMRLTDEGREHYGIGQRKQPKSGVVGSVKARIRSRIDERRGPSHLSDEELNNRVKRLRTEAEYARLQREIKGGNQGGGKKGGGGKKHPYLALAVLTPVATAIGVGTKAITAEKVNKFLDKRANVKLKQFMNAAKNSTSTGGLSKLLEAARRSAETAGHPIQNMPDVKSIVSANKAAVAQKKIAKKAVQNVKSQKNKNKWWKTMSISDLDLKHEDPI